MTPSDEVLEEFDKIMTRRRLLEALGPPVQVRCPQRVVYEYDATWKCERYGEADQGIIWPDCPTGTEQDVDKRMEWRGIPLDSPSYRRGMEQGAADKAANIEWCRSCRAKKWLADNPAEGSPA